MARHLVLIVAALSIAACNVGHRAAAAGVVPALPEVRRATLASFCAPVIIAFTSSPEQKAGSVPVTMAQRTALSALIWRKADSSSS